jgi:hypothetical protein
MKYAAVLVAALACSASFASGPGQPIDVADWVVLDPTLQVSTWVERTACHNMNRTSPALCHLGLFFHWNGPLGAGDPVGSALDAAGNHWVIVEEPSSCPSFGERERLYRCGPAGGCEQVAWIPRSKCSDGGEFRPFGLWIDVVNGYLYIRAETGVWGDQSSYAHEVHRFSGLTTMIEVMQTFTPQAALGFRVPVMPEGMDAADHFDTYTGPLTKPLDFTQAQPLACDYPSAPPAVGDYLSVADPLADPAPGTGRYYLTSATYEGMTRYGRKTTAGVLSGRDPSFLPACNAP